MALSLQTLIPSLQITCCWLEILQTILTISLWLSCYLTRLSRLISHLNAEVNGNFLSLKEDHLPCHSSAGHSVLLVSLLADRLRAFLLWPVIYNGPPKSPIAQCSGLHPRLGASTEQGQQGKTQGISDRNDGCDQKKRHSVENNTESNGNWEHIFLQEEKNHKWDLFNIFYVSPRQ